MQPSVKTMVASVVDSFFLLCPKPQWLPRRFCVHPGQSIWRGLPVALLCGRQCKPSVHWLPVVPARPAPDGIRSIGQFQQLRHRNDLCLMLSHLLISVFGCRTFLQAHSFEYGVLAELFFNIQQGILKSAFFGKLGIFGSFLFCCTFSSSSTDCNIMRQLLCSIHSATSLARKRGAFLVP